MTFLFACPVLEEDFDRMWVPALTYSLDIAAVWSGPGAGDGGHGEIGPNIKLRKARQASKKKRTHVDARFDPFLQRVLAAQKPRPIVRIVPGMKRACTDQLRDALVREFDALKDGYYK